MTFSSIESVLNKNIPDKSALKSQVRAALVCDEFDAWVLDKWADLARDKVKALYFKDNTLTIACLSSVLASEIKLHEREILEFLNLKFNLNLSKFRYMV